MHLDAELLARIQFALTASFHYLYPPFTIGLAWLMVVMEAQWVRTGDAVYDRMARFWTKIFAATFAMGVTTGIVMEFEFGTNWAAYSRFVGDVFGAPLAAEALLSFFIESTFLGVVIFGWDRVSKGLHFFATIMVAVGATLSSLWIIVANSWQQTPAGYKIVGEGKNLHAEITSFWEMFFNPSSLSREAHVIGSALTTACFVVIAVSAWYLLKKRNQELAKHNLKIGITMGLIATVLTAGAGHHQGQLVAKHQPAKLAAFEGHFKTVEGGAPLYLIGYPDVAEQRVRFGLAIPGGLSMLAYNSFTQPVAALDQFPKEDWPPILISFFSFHAMIGLGTLMGGLLFLALIMWLRGRLFEQRWLLSLLILALPLPFITNEVGWISAEVGRQPWIVQGFLRTKDALSESVSAGQILGSTLMFISIYSILFALYMFIIIRKIKAGPEAVGHDAGEVK